MEKKKTFREALQEGQVFAPCIWDCFSMRACEKSGFKAALVSGSAVSWSHLGMPDIRLMTSDELVDVVARIADSANIPFAVDCDDGYGESPVHVYRTVSKLIKAGATALTIDDTTGISGWERCFYGDTGYFDRKDFKAIVSKEDFLAKITAALDAAKGTDCMIIARTCCKSIYGLDEAIDRMVKAEKIGCEMTLIIGEHTMEESKKICDALPGWKMYGDINLKQPWEDYYNGYTDKVPNVTLAKLDKLNYRLVTSHFFEQGAWWGMLDFGKHNWANQDNTYSEFHHMGEDLDKKEINPYSYTTEQMDYRKWLDMEKDYLAQAKELCEEK